MNLLYLTFGNNTSVHIQAAFSIYSFLTQAHATNTINIITDNAAFYKHLEHHVNVIPVSKNELKDWKGEQQFFWRIKLKAIEKICLLYPGEPVLYLDTDTFLFGDAITLKNKLAANRAFMHENEGQLSGKKSKTEKKMWRQVANKSFGNIVVKPSDCMWNAGVAGTPNTQEGKECRLALAICDEMCEKGITKRLIEQFALSIALEKCYGLQEAKTDIAHYWSAKELWNRQIHDFFIEAYFAQWDFNMIVGAVRIFDTGAIPVSQKIGTTNLRLKGLIDKLFSTKNIMYLHKGNYVHQSIGN